MEDLISRLSSDEPTKEEKLECANISIKLLINKLIENHGGTFTHWFNQLGRTKLYRLIMNVDTGYWGEGTSYLYAKFKQETGLK